MSIRQAIRNLWKANVAFNQGIVQHVSSEEIGRRKQFSIAAELELEKARDAFTGLLLIVGSDGEGDLSEGMTKEAVDFLLQQGIIYECEDCEEREDLVACYGGEHREFHYTGTHVDDCAIQALRVAGIEAPFPEINLDPCTICGVQPQAEGKHEHAD